MMNKAARPLSLIHISDATKASNASGVSLKFGHILTQINFTVKAADALTYKPVSYTHLVMSYARQIGQEVHLSTQLKISNVEALRFYAQFADVVVLARELNLEDVYKRQW